ncbi:MAG TPA: tetratricopeptide repeat protein [Bryobacteraceae bacterium]|jgi:Flp pilus assembly protein TadD
MQRLNRKTVLVLAAWLLSLPAAIGLPQSAVNADLRSGLVALDRGDLAQACEFLERAVKQDPRNSMGWVALAQTYLRSSRRDDAMVAAKSAAQFVGDAPAIEHALALFYAGAGDAAAAASWERRFAASTGAGAEAAANAAALSLDAGEPEPAIRWARTALEREDSPRLHNLLGKAYQAAGQLDKAIAEYRLAARVRPPQEGFVEDLGQALLLHQDFEQALAVLEEGRRQFPASPSIALSLGVACYGRRRFEDAVTAFLDAIGLDPSLEQPYVFLGRILDHAGERLPLVIQAYAAWEKREPGNYLPVFLHAKALAALSGPPSPEIEAELLRSMQLNGSFWESHLELGVLLARRADWRAAAQRLSRSIELNPKSIRAHYQLALVYQRLGNRELARKERAEYERLNEAANASGEHQ